MNALSRILPGALVALAVALVAQPIADVLGGLVLSAQGLDPVGRKSPVSAIPVAVVLGLLAANTVGVPDRLGPGLTFSVKKVLKFGIVLVGLKLSFLDVLQLGALGVPVVFALVTLAMVVALLLARKLGVGERLGSLAAASTAICGITATLAVAPSVDADDREVAYTVANVTLLGLFGMLVYPYLAHALFADQPGAAGLFLGTAIHDTSQVMGAALTYAEVYADPRVMEVATVAKLTRNALLVAVVPIVGWAYARSSGGGVRERKPLHQLFPLFVVGFLALSLVRTVGDVTLGGGAAFGLLPEASWRALLGALGGDAATLALATALAAVGLQARLSVLRGLGPRPFVVGLAAAMTVALASLGLAAAVGPYLG